MRTVLWLAVIYEFAVGAADLASQAVDTNMTGLSTVADLPSVGSIVGGLSTSVSSYAGAFDIATAGAIWYFGLR